MDNLDLIPTEQLVEELFSRSTFAGVMIYSPEEHRFAGQQHGGFILRSTTTNATSIAILRKGLDAIKQCIKDCE